MFMKYPKPSDVLSVATCAMALLLPACDPGDGSGGAGGTSPSGGAQVGGTIGSGGAGVGGQNGTGGSGSGGTRAGGSGDSGSGGRSTGGAAGSSSGGTSVVGSGGKASGGAAAGGSAGNGLGGASAGRGDSGSGGSVAGTSGNVGGSSGASGAGGGNGGGTARGGSAGGGGAGGLGLGNGGSSGGGTTGMGGSSGSCSSDTCPSPGGGVTIGCKKRFMYGVNYAWSSTNGSANFGTDFGGLSAWNKQGVAAAKAARTTDMKDMKESGVDVLRWWMFPFLAGDGVKLDSSKTPTGVGGTLVDDINAALDIAKTLDMHIKLTLFSFDSFWNDFTTGGLTVPGLKPIITDDAKRAALISKVVVPVAQAVESSPNKDRMITWDVINEPEWSITGSDPYGDQAFDPTSSGSDGRTMGTVTFAQMETFVKDVVTALHANSSAPVTVGSAAVKWAKAWSKVGLDYYDFHWYGWVDQYFPHTKTPTDYKVDDKPVVVGEFPLVPSSDTTGQSFGGIKYGKLIDDWFAAGYAGAQGWAFSETQGAFSWTTGKTDVKAWASGKCYTQY
jgi:hypothetical protein